MIHYHLRLDSGAEYTFTVDRRRNAAQADHSENHADWTRLEYNRCPMCPLSPHSWHYCPAALDIEQIATTFDSVSSHAKAMVEVVTPERTYTKHCDVQTALLSLLGLLMSTSGCPIFSKLRSLTTMHLPFATVEETLFRTVGYYLIKQYFAYKSGKVADLDLRGLSQYYETLQTINRHFNKRLTVARGRDANMNAVVALSCLSMGVSYSLEDNLTELRALLGPDEKGDGRL